MNGLQFPSTGDLRRCRTSYSAIRRLCSRLLLHPCSISAVAFAVLAASPAHAQSAKSDADALRELKEAAATPQVVAKLPPGQQKTKEQTDTERAEQIAACVAAARAAKSFQKQYPKSAHLAEVRTLEVTSLLSAVRSGGVAYEEEAQELAQAFIADQRNARHERFVVASLVKHGAVQKRKLQSPEAVFAAYEENAAELRAQFGDEPEWYWFRLGLARTAPDPAKARQLASDLLSSAAPEEVKVEAQAVIDRQDLAGKTLPLAFVVSDGTRFDLAQSKGTAVVVYLWANASEPSATAMPAIRQAAATTSARFIGVNLDQTSLAQRTAPDGQPPPGPQAWEPLGLGGAIPRQLRADRVPMVYVFDAGGVLVGFGSPDRLAALLASAGATSTQP